MRRCLTLILVFLIFLVIDVVSQVPTESMPYILNLSPESDPTSLSIEYFITGSFGGYGSFVRTEPNRWKYEVPTTQDGKPARTLKLIIRGSKYKTLLYDFPSLSANGGKIEARLELQRQLEFKGKISSTESITDSWMQLAVVYFSNWKCDFLGLLDCMLGPERIALIDIDSDGAFEVSLPDFASDPDLSRFADKGSFRFFIRDRKTGNVVYDLRPAENSRKGLREVSVAARYPETQLFVAVRAN